MLISYKYSLLHTSIEVATLIIHSLLIIHRLLVIHRLLIIHLKHEAARCRNKQRIATHTLFIFDVLRNKNEVV